MAWIFEWDPDKDSANRFKHGVGFAEASSTFEDPCAVIVDDTEHSLIEVRSILLGLSARGRLLVVVFMDCGENVRLISARKATPSERRAYEEIL